MDMQVVKLESQRPGFVRVSFGVTHKADWAEDPERKICELAPVIKEGFSVVYRESEAIAFFVGQIVDVTPYPK